MSGSGFMNLGHTKVEEWLKSHTYSCHRFVDRQELAELKRKLGVTVSLVIPTLNEEANIGRTLRVVCEDLIDQYQLVDECVIMDSSSTDATRDIARSFDSSAVAVHVNDEVLPDVPIPRPGKGEGLWRGLHVTTGDIVLYMDADIKNVHYRLVTGILGPLLLQEDVHFVKGFYSRRKPNTTTNPEAAIGHVASPLGGRVTELCARPALNLGWPELAAVLQPLSGAYGGRRLCLETVSYSSSYGVELQTLIGVYEAHGLFSIAQTDLLEIEHESQSLSSLSRMSFVCMQVATRSIGIPYCSNGNMLVPVAGDAGRQRTSGSTAEYLRSDEYDGVCFQLFNLAEIERPPIIRQSLYQDKHYGDCLTLRFQFVVSAGETCGGIDEPHACENGDQGMNGTSPSKGLVLTTLLPSDDGNTTIGLERVAACGYKKELPMKMKKLLQACLGLPDQTTVVVPVLSGSHLRDVLNLLRDVRPDCPPTVPRFGAKLRRQEVKAFVRREKYVQWMM